LPKDLLDQKNLEGVEISFEPCSSEDGKPRARNIQPLPLHPRAPLMPAPHGMARHPPAPQPPSWPGYTAEGTLPVTPPPPRIPTSEPRVAVGTVTNYDAVKGFGFLKVDGIMGDVFFPRAELPSELRDDDRKDKVVGKLIEFELKKNARWKT